MYFSDDSLFPENMQPLIITAAPFGPEWLPGDCDLPLTWDEQVQRAVDCYNAGATTLHVHVRDPKTGQGSTNFDEYNYFLWRLKVAVPQMILQVGGSISFSPTRRTPRPSGWTTTPATCSPSWTRSRSSSP
jgi:uncharacterized protein (DUF849 family)